MTLIVYKHCFCASCIGYFFPCVILTHLFFSNCIVFHVSILPRPHRMLRKWWVGACLPVVCDSETKGVKPAQGGAGWIYSEVLVLIILPRRTAVWLSKAKALRPGSLNIVTHSLCSTAYMPRSQHGKDQILPQRNWEMQSFSNTVFYSAPSNWRKYCK